MSPAAAEELRSRFACFGGSVAVFAGDPNAVAAERSLRDAEDRLLGIHDRLSRFDPESELSRLNANPRARVPASAVLCRLGRAAIRAARLSGGLVDATRLGSIEAAGYIRSLVGATPVPLRDVLAAAPARRPAGPHPDAAWRRLGVEPDGTISRPPGLGLDSGGIAKGLAADLVAASLERYDMYAVDCAGDLRIGGCAAAPRTVRIDNPFGGPPLTELEVTNGGVATSGIGKRSWLRADGSVAHHLLDPATGMPAYTGVVQATALAPTAFLAEVLAKTAVLSGPERAAEVLPHGGVLVLDDESVRVV